MSNVTVFPEGGPKAAASELSEDAIAQQFEYVHRGRVVYAHTFGHWLYYDPETGIWQVDRQEKIAHWIREFIRKLSRENRARWGKAAVIDAVARLVRRAPDIALSGLEFDADPDTLGTADGLYSLRTSERLAPDPGLRISKTTAVAPAPGTPKRWARFLQDTTGGDQALVEYLQRLCGYCLTGHTREESLEFIYGPGGNGKGVFMGTLLDIAGGYGRQASMDTFIRSRSDRHPADLADLQGARVVFAAESAEGARWDEQRVKMATGRDKISARFMRGNFFEYTPQFTLLIASNHKPRIGTVDAAWERRLHLIPFEQRPANPDPHLKDALRDEYPQILAWMIEGAEWWHREGLAPPERVTAATREYLVEEDVIGLWFGECCIADPTARIARSDLHNDYERWCGQMGHKASSMHKLTRWLKAHGFEQDRRKSDRPFIGMRLKKPDEADIPPADAEYPGGSW